MKPYKTLVETRELLVGFVVCLLLLTCVFAVVDTAWYLLRAEARLLLVAPPAVQAGGAAAV